MVWPTFDSSVLSSDILKNAQNTTLDTNSNPNPDPNANPDPSPTHITLSGKYQH